MVQEEEKQLAVVWSLFFLSVASPFIVSIPPTKQPVNVSVFFFDVFIFLVSAAISWMTSACLQPH